MILNIDSTDEESVKDSVNEIFAYVDKIIFIFNLDEKLRALIN